jgi:hypothetical protein
MGWITDPVAVIDAIQAALREALKIPEGDRILRLTEHPVSHFAVPPGRSEKFTLVVPELDIKITLIETPPENWGLCGGMPASEIDLGFRIDV